MNGDQKMNLKLRTVTFTAAMTMILLLFVSTVNAENNNDNFIDKQVNMKQNDSLTIARKVQKKINQDMFYTVFDWVTVKDSSNVLVLKGWVHVPWNKEIFEKEALKYSGPLRVKNEIKNALGDDNLRWTAERTLYTDSEFENYIFYQNPPIHIIVIGDKIYLYGNVLSVSQKEWAGDLTRFGTDAVQIINYLNVNSNEAS